MKANKELQCDVHMVCENGAHRILWLGCSGQSRVVGVRPVANGASRSGGLNEMGAVGVF